jgi:hypothetical protein
MHQELAGIVAAEMKNGATLVEAERKAAERLLAVSQTLVPVDTGNLRDSGFIEVVLNVAGLRHSAAFIIRQAIVNGGLGAEPGAGPPWPVYASCGTRGAGRCGN